MGRIFLGYWNCDSCGSKMIKGNIKNCPNCGKRANPETKYIATDKREYVSEDEAKHINKNPDWLCNYCEQYNSDNDTTCISCGASREQSSLNYFQVRKKQEEKSKKVLNYSNTYSKNDSTKEECKNNSFLINTNLIIIIANLIKKLLTVVLIFSIFIIGIVFLVKLFTPKEQKLTVDSFEWRYIISIDKLKTFNESGWELPNNARLIEKRQEEYGTKKVPDGFATRTREVQKKKVVGFKTVTTGNVIDLGNGYFEEETEKVPIYEYYMEEETYEEQLYKKVTIYKTKYYYQIDRMVFDREIVTSNNDRKPYWGEVVLSSDEEISQKKEEYYVYCTDENGKQKKISLSFDDWNYIQKGNAYTFKVSILGNATLVK